MKVLIENYRGFDIHFNTSLSKFVTSITEEDDKSSNSFKAVKAEIDTYIKENNSFEPFYIKSKPSYRKDIVYKVVGIRKDGRFTIELEDGTLVQISDFQENEYMLHLPENVDIFTELREAESEFKKLESAHLKHKDEIIAKLNIITLRDHKKTLNL